MYCRAEQGSSEHRAARFAYPSRMLGGRQRGGGASHQVGAPMRQRCSREQPTALVSGLALRVTCSTRDKYKCICPLGLIAQRFSRDAGSSAASMLHGAITAKRRLVAPVVPPPPEGRPHRKVASDVVDSALSNLCHQLVSLRTFHNQDIQCLQIACQPW